MKRFLINVMCCIIFAKISRSQALNLSFPRNFTIGAGTSSYQVEGAWNISDKGESTWDHFTHHRPGRIADRSNGDIACDSYHRYEEDVQLIKDLGLDYYRFSISWARVLRDGFTDHISDVGLQYYKNLTKSLLANNITPIVTLYGWDHPQVLEDMGGWTNELMVDWFADYARVMFAELGPFVKTFITIDQPKILCQQGYNAKTLAPGKELEDIGQYICVHNVLKAHAKAYHIYDSEFRPTQQGEIGLVENCFGWVSGDKTSDASIDRYFQFDCGWTMHPIFIGDYPEIMKTRIAMISKLEGWPFSRLPEFSEEWIGYIRGTTDFFGLDHYTSSMPIFDPQEELNNYTTDSGIIRAYNSSWSDGSSSWTKVLPIGFGNLLRYIKDQYGNPPLYIFGNGYADTGALDDYERINYHHEYLSALLTAANDDGCNIRKYTIWSLLDNFGWENGYVTRFGIISVDFTSPNRTRTAKLSSAWWKEVIRTRQLQPIPTNNGSS